MIKTGFFSFVGSVWGIFCFSLFGLVVLGFLVFWLFFFYFKDNENDGFKMTKNSS